MFAWQTWEVGIGPYDFRGQGLGGWTLSAHHFYDPAGKVLYFGDGKDEVPRASRSTTVGGIGEGARYYRGDGGSATNVFWWPEGINIGPDGRLYIADTYNHVFAKCGNGWNYHNRGGKEHEDLAETGVLLHRHMFNYPRDVKVGPDGSIYIADTGTVVFAV